MTPALRHGLAVVVGAVASAALVIGVAYAVGVFDDDDWVVTPLGLSLRLGVRHPASTPPSDELKRKLHTLGTQARADIKACIQGVPQAPSDIELVFDDGTVELASGPVNVHSEHGRCTAQVLEGLWGELDGHHRLVVDLSLK